MDDELTKKQELVSFEFVLHKALLPFYTKAPLHALIRFLDCSPAGVVSKTNSELGVGERPRYETVSLPQTELARPRLHQHQRRRRDQNEEVTNTGPEEDFVVHDPYGVVVRYTPGEPTPAPLPLPPPPQEYEGPTVELDSRLRKMFSYQFGKGKSFLLRCTPEELVRRTENLPLFVLLYLKAPTDSRVLASCVLPLSRMFPLADALKVVPTETDEHAEKRQMINENANTAGRFKLLFDLNSRPVGWISIECRYSKTNLQSAFFSFHLLSHINSFFRIH